jgi:hypothetical protein
MKLDKSLELFRAAIESLQSLLHKFNDRGVIIGGVAAGFLGRPRFTADIDVSLGMLPFEEDMVARSSTKSFANLSIRLPTPEDLIIMKAIAHRPKDLEDIRTIAEKYSDLDIKRIEEWVKSFGDALEQPDLWAQVKSLLG